MLTNVLIIANPVAGKGQADMYASELRKILTDNYQSVCRIRTTSGEEDASLWASLAYEQGYDTVICLGGDGTVQEVIQGLMQIGKKNRPKFGFVPLGTVNDLARAIGYNLNPKKAVDQFTNVQLDTLDIGKVNDTYFIDVVAIGSIPEGVMNTQSKDKNRFGIFAYISDGFQAFFSKKGYQLKIHTADGADHTISTNLVLVALTNSVGSIEFMFDNATYNDGKIHFGAVIGHSPIDTLRAIIEKGFNMIEPKNVLTFATESVTIEPANKKEETPSNVDGDPGPSLPLDIKVIASALEILIPAEV